MVGEVEDIDVVSMRSIEGWGGIVLKERGRRPLRALYIHTYSIRGIKDKKNTIK